MRSYKTTSTSWLAQVPVSSKAERPRSRPPGHGTDLSAGGFAVLDLFHQGSDLDACLEKFEGFARRIFASRPSQEGVCDKFCRFFRSWLRDSLYPSAPLEEALKEAFGTTRRLFDVADSRVLSTKIGIMATSVATSRLRIFSNYNGVRDRQAYPDIESAALDSEHKSGYRLLRPERSCDEPLLWEV